MKGFLKNKKNKGFSLIEIMVALLLLTALVLGGSAALSYSRSMIAKQKHQRAALAVATSVMEDNIHRVGIEQLNQWVLDGNPTQNTNITFFGINFSASSTSTALTGGLLHVMVSVSSPTVQTLTLGYTGQL